MSSLFQQIPSFNLVSVLIVCLVIGSLFQGLRRGASGSARHLLFLVVEGGLTAVALVLSWRIAETLSPQLQAWLMGRAIVIPQGDIGVLQQIYYTLVTGIRDLPLFRFGFVFIISYILLKQILYWICYQLLVRWESTHSVSGVNRPSTLFSSIAGGTIGSVIGMGRALLMVAVLFVYVSVVPQAPFTNYIQASQVYQKGATQIIEPFTGDFIAKKAPVFTRAVEDEFNKILQRKYEVLDQNIPNDIAEAARKITEGQRSSEGKARALYNWVGSRIQYNHEKVRLYVEENKWLEQTPEDTFATRKGVCIDYSRLYAVMARSVGLDVKVVTGLGYDGRGGYGPHAWNEVEIGANHRWIPLDTTWANAGNWFDPPNFYQMHVKNA